MRTLMIKLLCSKSGAAAIEYGLIAALISVAIIAGVTTVGTDVAATFTTVGGKLATANGGW
jgi:pilus assembly protein Flp/PilA